ncbi:MAG: hypothetical protein COA96_14095 [SAR86 cluster bacterium]|uniref:Uncharacterized protein n=1 Tax=SAR86 cluster bacterium TaxID=2030880 RepID=A0A2A5AT96_9GAMM|nr:MAG: hypothetical protein COA96_14095 [SAR86 cluster bacterium]
MNEAEGEVAISIIDALRDEPCILAILLVVSAALLFAFSVIRLNNKHSEKIFDKALQNKLISNPE